MRRSPRSTPLHMARMGGVLAAVLLSLEAGSGCIFFIDDDASKLGTTCHVASEDHACGKCIATMCQPLLDKCCGDPSCSSTLTSLDACIADFTTASCATYATAPASAKTSEDALRTCIVGCAAGCRASTGASITNCYSYGGSSCTCSGTKGFNDTACSSDSVGTGVCCADYGWPNTGLSCECESYKCKETGPGSCTCGTSTSGPSSTCTGGLGAICCATSYGTCSCGSKDCSSTDDRVQSCGPFSKECGTGKKAVTSCSATTGSRPLIPDAGRDG